MQITVPYGKRVETCDVPDWVKVSIKKPFYGTPLSDAKAAVTAAVEDRIGPVPVDKLGPTAKVAVAMSDITRPLPLKIILPQLLKWLRMQGVDEKNVVGIVGGGLHRLTTRQDIDSMIGESLQQRVKIEYHNPRDKQSLAFLGNSSCGTPIFINKKFYEADMKIIIGMLEPHQFMGFSAGVKGAVIGLGGEATIEQNHSLFFQQHAELGVLDNNPVRDDLEEIGAKVGIDMILNVVLNGGKEILKVVAGHPVEAHRVGVAFAREVFGVPAAAADIVVASPGGFPKDINVYQAQKALTPAARMVKNGGVIILVAQCPEGLGEERFAAEMKKYHSWKELMEQFPNHPFRIGAHKAYLWGKSLIKAETIVVSDKLPASMGKTLMCLIMPDLQMAVDYALEKIGKGAFIEVLPAASSTIPL